MGVVQCTEWTAGAACVWVCGCICIVVYGYSRVICSIFRANLMILGLVIT